MRTHDKQYVKIALDAIFGKWKPEILWHLRNKSYRFNELLKVIPNISKKMLIEQLRKLEKDGIVCRNVYNEVPPKVEYSLTEYGKTLCPIFTELEKWGKGHLNVMDNSLNE